MSLPCRNQHKQCLLLARLPRLCPLLFCISYLTTTTSLQTSPGCLIQPFPQPLLFHRHFSPPFCCFLPLVVLPLPSSRALSLLSLFFRIALVHSSQSPMHMYPSTYLPSVPSVLHLVFSFPSTLFLLGSLFSRLSQPANPPASGRTRTRPQQRRGGRR